MQIEKRIRLNNHLYYIVVDVEYKNDENNFPSLYLKENKNYYWDEGDCSILIKKIEASYTEDKAKLYNKEISYMADILYIYDRMPFISGIKDISFSSKDNIPYSIGYISKQEIEKFIIDNKVAMNDNPAFKLGDERTWKL